MNMLENAESSVETLRPLCAMGMTVKYRALIAINEQASTLPVVFDNIRNDTTTAREAQAKCSGLLLWLESFEFCFAFSVALKLFQLTDQQSSVLQNPKLSAGEGLESALSFLRCLQEKRNDTHFEGRFDIKAF